MTWKLLCLIVYHHSRRNRVNHLGGGVFLSQICTFAFKFLKFAHILAHLGGFNPLPPLISTTAYHNIGVYLAIIWLVDIVRFYVLLSFFVSIGSRRLWWHFIECNMHADFFRLPAYWPKVNSSYSEKLPFVKRSTREGEIISAIRVCAYKHFPY